MADIQQGMFFGLGDKEVDISLTAMTDGRGCQTAPCQMRNNQRVYEILESIITARNERGRWLGTGIYKADNTRCC